MYLYSTNFIVNETRNAIELWAVWALNDCNQQNVHRGRGHFILPQSEINHPALDIQF